MEEGISEVEKLKRQKGLCHAKKATTHLVLENRKETAQTEMDKLTEEKRNTEAKGDDQKDCSHNDEASDWMDAVSIQLALISVNSPLTETTQ